MKTLDDKIIGDVVSINDKNYEIKPADFHCRGCDFYDIEKGCLNPINEDICIQLDGIFKEVKSDE